MSSTQDFDPSAVFELLAMRSLDPGNFDEAVISAPGDDLRCIFFWGTDCYNCNLFKNTALMLEDRLTGLGLSWFEVNAYEHEALGRRFGLHGVPAFVFYRSGKRLGRISGWPGWPQFSGAVQRLQASGDDAPAS